MQYFSSSGLEEEVCFHGLRPHQPYLVMIFLFNSVCMYYDSFSLSAL